jgi:hypothetical protein
MTPERIAELKIKGTFSGQVDVEECLDELERLQTPKPAPRCPKCGSDNIEVHRMSFEPGYFVTCREYECEHDGATFLSIDAALDAWREGGGK